MVISELDELKELWEKKYPDLFISLWTNEDSNHYYGKMMVKDNSMDLNADSIAGLIHLGEEFLRRVRI